jgi:Tol biopolymer transport system component
VLICGTARNQALHCAIQDLKGAAVVRAGDPSKIIDSYAPYFASRSHIARNAISPDGATLVVEQDPRIRLLDLRSGSTRIIVQAARGEQIARWSPDGRTVWVVTPSPPELQALDIVTGKRTTLLPDLFPAQGPQVTVNRFAFADDPRTYAFVSHRVGSDLFAVRGAR